MKKIISILILIPALSPVVTTAQQNDDAGKKKTADSIKAVYLDAYALKYPILRQVTVSQEFVTPGTLKTQLYGKDVLQGKLGIIRTVANINIPVATWKNNNITVSLGMVNQEFKLDNVNSYTSGYTIPNENVNRTSLNASVNYTHSDSLFGLPVIFNVGITSVMDPTFSQQRFTYRGLVTFSLMRNANSSLSVGGLFIKDPSSPTPFVPYFSYSHKFKSLDAELLVDLPYRVAFRKELTNKSSLTALSELTGNLSFFNLDQTTLPKNSIYSTLDAKMGMMFEYRLSKKVIFSISGGLLTTVSSKMSASDAKPSDYFIKNNNQPVPYANIGISVLPFFHKL